MTEIVEAPELMGVQGLFHFAKDPLGAFGGAARTHGDAVAFTQLRGDYVLVTHPSGVEAVLQHRGGELEKDLFTRDLATILGQGLLNAEGETWRRQRKLMAPTFQPRELAPFDHVMVECVDELVRGFSHGELRDVHGDGMHLALDIVVRTLFGSKLERFADVERALDTVSFEYRLLWQTWRALLPRFIPLPSHRRLRRVRSELDAILDALLEKKRETPGKDLLSQLIALTDEEGHGMTDQQLRDEAMTLFLAGHETTALAITYTLRLLATHPEQYRRLLAEVDQVLAGRAPTQADVERLPFTSAVVREGLRLYPPVWSMARYAVKDVRLAGMSIRANTQLILSQWVTQRDARWFPEPEQFRPERWLGATAASVPRFAYFPFGGGPRVCVGQHFALLELVLVLARLSQAVVFEPSGEKLVLDPVITLRPRGTVRLGVLFRSKAKLSVRPAAE